jgi:hypothetical protein
MPRAKPYVDPRQLPLFPGWSEECPLCRMPNPLVTCRRLYNVQWACEVCAKGLQKHGWTIMVSG